MFQFQCKFGQSWQALYIYIRMYVLCVRACVCVYIYIKRESNIYESIFSYFVMRAIDKKQKEDKVLFFFSSVGHCHIILKGSVYFLEKN